MLTERVRTDVAIFGLSCRLFSDNVAQEDANQQRTTFRILTDEIDKALLGAAGPSSRVQRHPRIASIVRDASSFLQSSEQLGRE
jgi:hypothetical protein